MHTIYKGLLSMHSLKVLGDLLSESWKNVRDVVGQQCAKSSHETDTFGPSSVKPVEAMHRVARL